MTEPNMDPVPGWVSEGHEHQDDLRPVDEVREWILSQIQPLSPIELPLQESWGCVLAAEVAAELDIPPFSSSAMDGFAIRASDVAAATVDAPAALRVAGRVTAGRQADTVVGAGEALYIANR